MSRSRKKQPGSTFLHPKRSQKHGKTLANRRFRHIAKQLLRIGKEVLPHKNRAVTDPYDLGGDGKVYRMNLENKYMRK